MKPTNPTSPKRPRRFELTPEHDNCPKCKVSLVGVPIPEEDRAYFGKATHFKREIGIEYPCYDGILTYSCPDCGHEWPRFTS